MEFQILYQEFLGSTAILHSLLNGLSPQDTRLKPDPESWSILEVLCHLYDEDREDFRTHLDLILNHPGESWPTIDPQAWVKDRKYNAQNFGEMKDKFFAQRAECLGWLKACVGAIGRQSMSRSMGKCSRVRCSAHGSPMIIFTSASWSSCAVCSSRK